MKNLTFPLPILLNFSALPHANPPIWYIYILDPLWISGLIKSINGSCGTFLHRHSRLFRFFLSFRNEMYILQRACMPLVLIQSNWYITKVSFLYKTKYFQEIYISIYLSIKIISQKSQCVVPCLFYKTHKYFFFFQI